MCGVRGDGFPGVPAEVLQGCHHVHAAGRVAACAFPTRLQVSVMQVKGARKGTKGPTVPSVVSDLPRPYL